MRRKLLNQPDVSLNNFQCAVPALFFSFEVGLWSIVGIFPKSQFRLFRKNSSNLGKFFQNRRNFSEIVGIFSKLLQFFRKCRMFSKFYKFSKFDFCCFESSKLENFYVFGKIATISEKFQRYFREHLLTVEKVITESVVM